MTDTNPLRPVIGRIEQLTTEPASPAGKEVMRFEARGHVQPVAPPPVSSDAVGDGHSCSYYCERPACIKAQRDALREQIERAANEQSGSCANVPLPEPPPATYRHPALGELWSRFDLHRYAIAYGEACAAHWRARAEQLDGLADQVISDTARALGCEPDNEKILEAIDALKARAEAAEDKIKGIGHDV